MSLDVPTTVTRRHAAVAAALSGAALVVVGYASGWGLTLPVAGSVVAGSAPVVTRPAGGPAAAPSSMGMPAHHYVGSGPAVAPTGSGSRAAVSPTSAAPTTFPASHSPTPAPSSPPASPTGMVGDCTGLRPMLRTLIQHVDAGHLEESPSQQVADLLDTDQYVKTHTVLIESLLKPLVGDSTC